MKRYELEAMKKDELIEHAEVAGIKLAADDTKGTMIDRILGEKSPADETVEAAAAAPVKKDAPLPPVRGGLFTLSGEKVNGKRYKLTILSTPGGDTSDVPIVVNGHNIIVKRGREVEVEEAYVNVLRDAVIDTVIQDPDTGEMIPQRVMNYPHIAVPV